MRRSNKLLKIIATGLLATTTLTSLPIYNGTADAKKLPKAKSAMSARAVDPKNTIASGWNVLKYSSDLNVSLNDTFVQNRPVIDGNGLVLDTAYINFANIGNSVFKAQHVFHMKKGKTYKINWYYGLRVLNGAHASIDFNGDVKVADASIGNAKTLYKKTIVSNKDQDYVVTMSYDAPRNSNVYMMIGYDANSASDGGFVEQDVPKPTLVAPQAWDKQVKGTGVSGNQIVIKDQVGKVLGTGTVGSDNSYSVGLSRPLVYNETITATQLNQDKVASDPVDATVEDTVAPDAPKAQNIEVSDQMLSGSAETGSKILAKNAQGKIVGEGAATGKAISKSNDSEFSFELTEPVTVGETITVTATDSAGLESTGTDVKVVDTVKPTAPKVNAVDDTMKQLTGTGSKVGSTIVASVNNQVFYGKVGADKTFTVNLGRTFSGGTLIKVIEIDQQNQQSDPTVVTVKGTQKTKTPTVNTVGDSDLELTGTAEPNADVTVTIGQDVYKGKADQNGNFKIQLNQKYPITSEGTVIATGTSGIASDAEKIKFEDTTPPNAPAINSVLPTDTTLSGTAEPNSTVRVVFTRPDGSTAVFQKPADKDGNFKINMLGTFPEGTTISATAEDAAGNISSAANAIVASKEKPTLSLSDLSSQDIQLTGTATRANTPVTVQVGDQVYQTKTDDGGKFILHLDRMFPAGTEVTATMGIGDKIGKANTTVLLRMPTFTTSNSPRVGMKKITLKADPNSDVTLTITHLDGGLGDIQTVQADEAGNATFTLVSPIRYGDTLDVFSTMLGVKNPSERGEISIF